MLIKVVTIQKWSQAVEHDSSTPETILPSEVISHENEESSLTEVDEKEGPVDDLINSNEETTDIDEKEGLVPVDVSVKSDEVKANQEAPDDGASVNLLLDGVEIDTEEATANQENALGEGQSRDVNEQAGAEEPIKLDEKQVEKEEAPFDGPIKSDEALVDKFVPLVVGDDDEERPVLEESERDESVNKEKNVSSENDGKGEDVSLKRNRSDEALSVSVESSQTEDEVEAIQLTEETNPEARKAVEIQGKDPANVIQEEDISSESKPNSIVETIGKISGNEEAPTSLETAALVAAADVYSILSLAVPASDILQRAPTEKRGTYTEVFYPPEEPDEAKSTESVDYPEESIESAEASEKGVVTVLVEPAEEAGIDSVEASEEATPESSKSEEACVAERNETVDEQEEAAPSPKTLAPVPSLGSTKGDDEQASADVIHQTKSRKGRSSPVGLFFARGRKHNVESSAVEPVVPEKLPVVKEMEQEHNDLVKEPTKESLPNNALLDREPSTLSATAEIAEEATSKPKNLVVCGEFAPVAPVNVPNVAEKSLSTLIDRLLDGTACGRQLDKSNCLVKMDQNVDDEIASALDDSDTQREMMMFDDDTFPTYDDDTIRDGDTLETTSMDDTLEDIKFAVGILKRHATRLGVSEADRIKKISEEQERKEAESENDPVYRDFDAEARQSQGDAEGSASKPRAAFSSETMYVKQNKCTVAL